VAAAVGLYASVRFGACLRFRSPLFRSGAVGESVTGKGTVTVSTLCIAAVHLSDGCFLAILSTADFVFEEAVLCLVLVSGLDKDLWASIPKQIVFLLLDWLLELVALRNFLVSPPALLLKVSVSIDFS